MNPALLLAGLQALTQTAKVFSTIIADSNHVLTETDAAAIDEARQKYAAQNDELHGHLQTILNGGGGAS